MKKIVNEQAIEFWVTRSRTGQLIRVYQYCPTFVDKQEFERDPLTIPILVDYFNGGESLVDILEERERLRKKVEHLEQNNEYEFMGRLGKLENFLNTNINKKWWQFWK